MNCLSDWQNVQEVPAGAVGGANLGSLEARRVCGGIDNSLPKLPAYDACRRPQRRRFRNNPFLEMPRSRAASSTRPWGCTWLPRHQRCSGSLWT